VRERYQTLLAGDGDATLLGPPFDGMAIARGARVLSRVNDRYPAFPGQGLVVRCSSDDRVRARVIAWLAALDHARAWALTTRNVAVSHLMEAGMPAPLAETMMEVLPNSLVPDQDGVALLIAQRQRAGLRGADVTYSDLVGSDLLDSVGYPRERIR
jgi:ABC-type nitrate/sulfonate/bicarbonate transport system substrate-binding protein